MIVKPHQVTWGIFSVLALLILLDGILLLYVRTVANASQDPNLLYRYTEDHVPVSQPDGYTARDVKIDAAASKKSGWAVRYAARECKFCQRDEALWNRLASELQRMGYVITVVVPSGRDAYPDDRLTPKGAQQEVYVNLAWIEHFRLTVTPTVLVFDSERGLIWAHQGMLDQADPESALRAIKSANEKIR